jgi:hypothetical protein
MPLQNREATLSIGVFSNAHKTNLKVFPGEIRNLCPGYLTTGHLIHPIDHWGQHFFIAPSPHYSLASFMAQEMH